MTLHGYKMIILTHVEKYIIQDNLSWINSNKFVLSQDPEIVLTNGDDVQVRQEARCWISGGFASRPELQSLLAQQTNGQHSDWTSAHNTLQKHKHSDT